MRDQARTWWRAFWAGGAAVTALTLAGCGGTPEKDPTPGTTSPASPGSSPSPSSTPGPSESARLYTQSRLSTDAEGDEGAANAAVRSFAEAISSGDRTAIDEALHAPTPEDPTVVDQTVRTFEDVEWDEKSLRWTETGVIGPCYILMGEGEDGPVHLAGTAAWNDAEGEWEFTTAGFPGSAEYPDLPTC